MECTDQGNDFELIPTVKMETRNPTVGYFCSEFWASFYTPAGPIHGAPSGLRVQWLCWHHYSQIYELILRISGAEMKNSSTIEYRQIPQCKRRHSRSEKDQCNKMKYIYILIEIHTRLTELTMVINAFA